MPTQLEDHVRQWAKGMYTLEAAAEVLIRVGKVYPGAPWLTPPSDGTSDDPFIDSGVLLHESMVWPDGERHAIRLAVSLLGGERVDLSEVLPGLDPEHLLLVLAAVAHAAGSHEFSEAVFNEAGNPTGFRQLSAAISWPEIAR